MVDDHSKDIDWGAAAAPGEVRNIRATWRRGNKDDVKSRVNLMKRTVATHPDTPLAKVARNILSALAKDNIPPEE